MDAFTWWQLCLMIFTLSSALVGGLLFAFSSFVMRGLDQAGPAAAIKTMQGINRTVFTPWVMIPFMGTAPFGLILTILAWTMEVSDSPIFITLAAAIYTVGVVGSPLLAMSPSTRPSTPSMWITLNEELLAKSGNSTSSHGRASITSEHF